MRCQHPEGDSVHSHHDLEAVERLGLGNLDLTAEALDKVLVDDTVRSGEESEDVLNKVALVVVELVVPVVEVGGEVDLLGGPERRLGLLVELPDLKVSGQCSLLAPQRALKIALVAVDAPDARQKRRVESHHLFFNSPHGT
jgi:hypothetical protein